MSADTSDKTFDKDSVLDRMWTVRNKSKPVLKSFQRNNIPVEEQLKVPGLPSESLDKFQASRSENGHLAALVVVHNPRGA